MTIKAAKLNRKFDVEEKSDGSVRITGRGAGLAGLGIMGTFFLVLLGLILCSATVEWLPLFISFSLIFVPAGLYQLLRSRSYDFTLTQDGVIKGRKVYSNEDVAKYRVYNDGRGAQINQELSYRVGMEYDRKLIPLASQLKEETANQIFDVIAKYKALKVAQS